MIEVWQVDHRFKFRFNKLMADKVTDLSVIINGRRAAKSSDGVRYFTTFEEAKTYAVRTLNNYVLKSKKDLSIAELALVEVTNTTPDTIKTSESIYR